MVQNNVKSFFNYVNFKLKSKDFPNEFSFNNVSTSDGQTIADLFADYFADVYTDRPCNIPDNDLSYGVLNLNCFNLSISEVYVKLNSLDTTKGPGPDGIHPMLLKNSSFILSRPLFLIFSKSLALGEFPDYWKSGFITPLYKSGNRSDVRNYRSISILSTIPKLFESIVTDYLSSLLSGLIIDQQFGFFPGRSTELNLLNYTGFLSSALESGNQVHAIYTDFSKAFDRVNHGLLVHKLGLLGVGGSMLSWINSYLHGRTQIVRFNNYRSKVINVWSGVPQGSHLGPLLFNLFINDINNCFKYSNFSLFADDLKLYKIINSTADCLQLQADLDRLSQWCVANCMDLNTKKCNTITFSKSRREFVFPYHINGEQLKLNNSVNDLGVLLVRELNFSDHIENIVLKSLKLLGFIKRASADFNNIISVKLLYTALVRPHLEYATSVWSPHYQVHKDRLEQVQHKFLRYIRYKFNLDPRTTYPELESLLNINNLTARRSTKDLKLLYNLLNFNLNCPEILESIGLCATARVTRFSNTFYVPFHRTNYGFYSPLPRICRFANDTNLDFFCPKNLFLRQLRFV